MYKKSNKNIYSKLFYIVIFLLFLLFTGNYTFATNEVTRVSVSSSGLESDDHSYKPSVSGDGKYTVYYSNATNLIEGDTNYEYDVFLYNKDTNETSLVSKSSAGIQSNAGSKNPHINGSGTYVVYHSDSNNLVTSDTNGKRDIFLYNIETEETSLVSKSSLGTQGNGFSNNAIINGDGKYIVYESSSSNLVAGDTNAKSDIFLYNRDTEETILISKSSTGVLGNNNSNNAFISGNGKYIVYESDSDNLVESDTNEKRDIFLYNIETQETTLINKSTSGIQANSYSYAPTISGDGKYIVYYSYATNLIEGSLNGFANIFLYNRETEETSLISKTSSGELGDGYSYFPYISSNGKFITFYSYASNFVIGDTNSKSDIFVYNIETEEIELINKSLSGELGDSGSSLPAISSNGMYIVYHSTATNLVPGDTNNKLDIFLTKNSIFEDLTITDTEAPLTTHEVIGTSISTGIYLPPVQLELSSTDEGDGVDYTMYSINGTGWLTYTGTLEFTNEGTYDINYYSIDLAGNIEETKSVSFEIITPDTIPPVTIYEIIGTSIGTGVYLSPVELTLTSTDEGDGVDYIMYSETGTGWLTYTGTIEFTEEGIYNIQYYAVDLAGNREETKSVSFEISSANGLLEKVLNNPDLDPKAYKQLSLALDPKFWTDGNTLSKIGGKSVFAHIKNAMKYTNFELSEYLLQALKIILNN